METNPSCPKFIAAILVAHLLIGTAASSDALAQQTAASENSADISLPRGPLAETLVRLGEVLRANIIADEALVANKSAPAIQGNYTVAEALNKVLTGFDLVAKKTASGAILIQAASKAEQRPAGVSREEPERPRIIDEIVVTGTKRNQSIQNTVDSVSVFTNEDIERQVLFNLSDVTLRTANVSQLRNRSIVIRGVDARGVGTAGSGLTSNIYIDGAPTTSTGVGLNLWDIQQVEVLRGPQSTTQGRNALAGAVIIQTADPEYDFGLDAQILAGSQDNRQYSAAVTGPILDDQIAFRLAADYREIDFGLRYDSTGNRASFEETLTLRGKLLFEPNFIPGLRTELNLQYVDTESTPINFVQAPVPFSDPSFSDFDPFGDTSFNSFSDTIETETTRLLLENSLPIAEHWSLFVLGTLEQTSPFFNRQLGISDREVDTISTEIRANFNYSAFEGWIGAYYFDEESSQNDESVFVIEDFGFVTDPAGSTLTSSTTNKTEVENYAVFADVTYKLSERWSFNAGFRFDTEEVFDTGNQGTSVDDPTDCIIPALGNLPCDFLIAATSEPAFTETFNAFLPRAGISYFFDEQRSLSFGVQRGYRAGGAFTLAGGEIRSFDPEFLVNYELALRSLWLDQRLSFNANVFYTDWEDQQVLLPDELSTSPVVTVNAGTSELFGLELSSTYDAAAGLQLFASLGLLETEFTDFPFAVVEDPNGGLVPLAADGGFANLSGNEFPSAPGVTATAGLNYENATGLFGSLALSYTGSSFTDVANLPANSVDDFFLVNLRVGYQFGPWQVSLFANNLLDEEFLTQAGLRNVRTSGEPVEFGADLIRDEALPIFRTGDRRQIGAVLRARF